MHSKGKFGLLGLGDVVLPGLFVALLLRFDASVAGTEGGCLTKSFRKPFFTANLFAYSVGLSLVLWMMFALEMAQV